jgi:hypothetical protein
MPADRNPEETEVSSRFGLGAAQLPEAGSIVSGDGSVPEGLAKEGSKLSARDP